MRTRTITSDLPPVTVVGCGEVSLTIAAARGIDHRDVARTVDEAIELGITMVDIADEEDAERVVGDAIRAHRARDRVCVATRAPLDERLQWRPIQQRVERSLRALKLDAIPLVAVPLSKPWLRSSAWPEVHEMLHKLVRDGKVIAWLAQPDATMEASSEPEPPPPLPPEHAVTMELLSSGQLDLTTAMLLAKSSDFGLLGGAPKPAPPAAPPSTTKVDPLFAAIAIPLSLCDRSAEVRIDRLALARHPLGGGALAGHLGPGVKLAKSDDRMIDLEANAKRLAKLGQLVEIAPVAAAVHDRIAEPIGRTVAELALRWAITRAGIALPRLHRREHLAEAIACASAPELSGAVMERIVGHVAESA